MLLKFLDKVETHYLDISTFINCSPERILFYYYDSYLYISLDTYAQMKIWAENHSDTAESCLNQWLNLIENELQSSEDLERLQAAEYLDEIGPYYYLPTNTRFFFRNLNMNGKECLSSVDFAHLFNLYKTVEANKDLQKYAKSRKNPKKGNTITPSLTKDMEMCIQALHEINRIHKHIQYQQALIEQRRQLLKNEDLSPLLPDNPPEKPSKPEEPDLSFNSLRSLSASRARMKEYENKCRQFGHELKKYLIKYREFEKACERYKEAILNWPAYKEMILARFQSDINEAQEKIKSARKLYETYQFILLKSPVHPDYHDIRILTKFEQYLQTGRANDLQDCMNLYEEEQLWMDIKASQQRIENTIYFLQGEGDYSELNSHIARKLAAATQDS